MRQDPTHPHVVATGGKENALKVWDLQGSEEPLFRAKNVRNDWLNLRVPIWEQDIQFLPESRKLVTCTGFHQVRVYDPASPQRRPVLEATYGEYPLTAMTLTPEGNSVIVGNTHGQLAEIDLRQGTTGRMKPKNLKSPTRCPQKTQRRMNSGLPWKPLPSGSALKPTRRAKDAPKPDIKRSAQGPPTPEGPTTPLCFVLVFCIHFVNKHP
ncbi:WD repeat-containing protein 74 isoform X1 [Echinops telfairi]|uniref:WD repeat-containing protein 74 isoform X1 n=1 Tax=Echinops telfairi TaxID=9371 RepID=A0AC55DN68_ECHTE|nr:WD repeat-containing protein 74 isoform X1 [Echinops telfairi]